jgi:hypothetical protein
MTTPAKNELAGSYVPVLEISRTRIANRPAALSASRAAIAAWGEEMAISIPEVAAVGSHSSVENLRGDLAAIPLHRRHEIIVEMIRVLVEARQDLATERIDIR